jgi:hypothetical protein
LECSEIWILSAFSVVGKFGGSVEENFTLKRLKKTDPNAGAQLHSL